MANTENNHWIDNLEYFQANLTVKIKLSQIEEKRREIDWMKDEIKRLEQEITNRVLVEYSQEEVNIAKAKFAEVQNG